MSISEVVHVVCPIRIFEHNVVATTVFLTHSKTLKSRSGRSSFLCARPQSLDGEISELERGLRRVAAGSLAVLGTKNPLYFPLRPFDLLAACRRGRRACRGVMVFGANTPSLSAQQLSGDGWNGDSQIRSLRAESRRQGEAESAWIQVLLWDADLSQPFR